LNAKVLRAGLVFFLSERKVSRMNTKFFRGTQDF